jgi:O-antigen/teichoic acid export membrane protein
MKEGSSLTKQTMTLMTGKGSGFLVSFLIPLVIVRLTSAEEFGTYKQFFLVFASLFSIAQFGMTQSIYYFVPENDRKGIFITQAYLFLVSSGLISFAGLCIFSGEVGRILNNPVLGRYTPLIGGFLCFMLGASLLEGLMIAESRIRTASVFLLLTEVIKAACVVVPIAITGDLLLVFVGIVCFSFLRFAVTTVYVAGFVRKAFKMITSMSLKEQLGYCLPLGISVVLFMLSSNLPNYFVSGYFTPGIYAVYAVALFYPPIIEVIEVPILEPMFVAIVKSVRNGDRMATGSIWHSSVRKLSLALLPIFVFSFAEAREIIVVLFTDAYLASVPIFMITILRILFACFIPENVVKAYGETKYVLRVNVITLIVSVLILVICVRAFGLFGAAFAVVAKEAVGQALLVNKARSLLGLTIRTCLPWRHLMHCMLISVASALPVVIYNLFASGTSFLRISLCFGVFFGSYVFVLFKSSVLSEEEKEGILYTMRRRRIRLFKKA